MDLQRGFGFFGGDAVSRRQRQAPLVAALRRYLRRGPIVFHVPGHLQGSGTDAGWRRLLGDAALAIDLTEAPGLDDLHAPTGPIKAAQILAAEAFGAADSHFLVGGSTVGLQAAILATCRPGDHILLPRHVHRSALGALALSGAIPVYAQPVYHPELGIPLAVEPLQWQTKLESESRFQAAVAVHPTYFGFAGPLAEYCRLAHERNVPVIADEAHGAHFPFHPQLPVPALNAGADISVQSWHKTLGSLTQSSVLHRSHQSRISTADLAQWLRILQSSSPSYLLMASLDAARRRMATSGERLWHGALETAGWVRDAIDRIGGLRCVQAAHLEPGWGPTLVEDPTKVLVDVRGRGVTGYQAARELWRQGLAVEMAGTGFILCLLTPSHRHGHVQGLVAALSRLQGHYRHRAIPVPPAPKVAMSPAQALRARTRQVPLSKAVGAVAAELVAPYPPGVPVLCPGEHVTAEIIAYIQELKTLGAHFQGPQDTTLSTLAVAEE